MSKRNNYPGDPGVQIEAKRSGGGKLLLALIVVIGAVYVIHAGSSYLQTLVPVAAGSDVNVGAWAVGGLVALFLAWCFLSGPKGGGR